MDDNLDTGGTHLIESRWRRYGKDRIYLRTADGRNVGYVDLVSREAIVSDPSWAPAVHATLGRWCRAAPANADAPRLVETTPPAHPWAPPTVPPEAGLAPPNAIDLAGNRPGAAAKARREQINAASPVGNIIRRVLGLRTEERSWRVGANGERKVGKELASLGAAWRVLHAIPIGERSSDIDHLVIGPGGVYTVNTKCHPSGRAWVADRAILVNGQRTDYLRNSRFEARRTSELLTTRANRSIPVRPVIVFVDLSDLTIKHQPADVQVTTRRRVTAWFQSQPSTMSADEVHAVYEVARLATTWRA